MLLEYDLKSFTRTRQDAQIGRPKKRKHPNVLTTAVPQTKNICRLKNA
jgi:hypothetical protein